MYQTDKCVVAQVLKVVVIINLIIIDHSRMIQAFRFIEISKYDDGGQLTTRGQLMQGSSTQLRVLEDGHTNLALVDHSQFEHKLFVLILSYVNCKIVFIIPLSFKIYCLRPVTK